MVKKIGLVVTVVVVTFLTYVALQSPDFQIAREITVNASAEKIFPHINNQKLAHEWMPWKEIDPTAEMVSSGPEEGVGAKSSWNSTGQMGTGEAEVVESVPNQSVKTKLTYSKPMTMSQMAEVSLAPSTDGTLVRWSVTGKNSFVGRLMCAFLNMDKMVGKDFERGLAKLKATVEHQ